MPPTEQLASGDAAHTASATITAWQALGLPTSVVLILVGVGLWSIPRKHWFESFLARKGYRHAFQGAVQLALPAAICVLYDSLDLQRLRKWTFVDTDRPVLAILGGAIVVYAWAQFLERWLSDRLNSRLVAAEKLADLQKSTIDYLVDLGKTYLGVVVAKHNRVRKFLKSVDGKPILTPDLVVALDPQEQIRLMVGATHDVVMKRYGLMGASLRVAYFQRVNEHLESAYAWDGASPDCCHSVVNRHRPFFEVQTQQMTCLAVHAYHIGQIEIVSDAKAADANSSVAFRYFDDHQRCQIRSIVAIPIRNQHEARIVGVLCVDTDRSDAFNANQRLDWELLRDNLQTRLTFEQEMHALTLQLGGQ